MKLLQSFGFFQKTNAGLSSSKILCLAFLLSLLGSELSFGQQWQGSSNATGNIHREGNVGIGTSQPESKLHVAGGDITLDNRMSIIFKNAAGQNDGTRISRFGGNALRFRYTGNTLVFDALNDHPFQIRNSTDSPVFSIRPNGHASFNNSGNLGIGTRNPVDILHLHHAQFPALRLTDGSNRAGQLALASANGFFSPISTPGDVVLRSLQDDVVLYSVRGSLRFATEAAGSGTNEKMTILSNGNVGVGTTNPLHKLAVNGTIRAKEIIVDTDWSDFVFEDDYELRSLEEIESYIKANGHLPEVPSEKEVKEHGVNLGEMQAKLLQKIEELTLYTIQQQKQIDELQQRLLNFEMEKHND
jgi:hypothetical protein